MKCFFHEEKSAVATCQNCGKSLCKPCAAKYTPCMCDECVGLHISHEETSKKQRKKDALIDTNAELLGAIIKGVISAVVMGGLMSLTSSTPIPFAMYVMFFFLPFGWALITYIEQWLPAFFMSGPIFLVYLVIKMSVSMMLGIFCFMFQIGIYILKMIKANTQK